MLKLLINLMYLMKGNQMEEYKLIERSIIKRFRKEVWHPFVKAINDYQLIENHDKIMVCISGGKDSFLMAKCLEELKRHGKIDFELKYVVMNPGYSQKNIDLIKKNSQLLNLDLEIFDTDVFEVANKLNEKSPCYLCARMRRGHLYSKAQELGCNKIALGHHFDDVIETTLLSMFYASEVKTMMPKLYSDHFQGLQLIRPMYYIKEKAIQDWVSYNRLTFLNCACKFVAKNDLENQSKRKEIKTLIENLRKTNQDIDNNIFKSLDNVNLNCILGYRVNEEKVSFLDHYN